MTSSPKRSPVKLFALYFVAFLAALILGVFVLLQLADGIRDGQLVLLLLPPLAGMALFHGLFPLLSKLRLGMDFVSVGGGLVYGVGALSAGLVWLGWLDPGSALVLWLAGVFGPGWWLLNGFAERNGYFT